MIKKLLKNQPAMMLAGFSCFVLFIILAIVSQFDTQEVLGINRWVKPMKFAISIAVYLWTLAVFLNFVRGCERAKNFIVYGTILMQLGEIILITMQSGRGTTSHFNVATLFDAIVFQSMGIMIFISTILFGLLTYLYFKARIDLPKAIVLGIRLGMIIFLAASFEGGLMAGLMSHSIGTVDGGAGLPLVNWSTIAGDLRVAHFFGMHGLQTVPLFAYTLNHYDVKSAARWTFIFAVVYFSVFVFLLGQALFGQPIYIG